MLPYAPSSDNRLAKNIRIMLVVRLLLVSVILGMGSLIFQAQQSFYLLIGAYYWIALVFVLGYLLCRKRQHYIWHSYAYFLFDIGLVTFIVHYTGGVKSLFPFAYMLLIIAAGSIISARAAIFTAVWAALSYGGLILLEALNVIKPHPEAVPYYQDMYKTIYLTNITIAIFFLVGFLTAYMSRRLKQKEEEVLELQSFYGDILKSISSGILTFDREGQVTFVNRSAWEMLNLTINQLLGEPLRHVMRNNMQLYQQVMRGVRFEQERLTSGEYDFQRDDGSMIPLGYGLSPLEDAHGVRMGTIVVFADLTERKLMEEKIRQHDRLSAIGELSAGIAHEIRNPLASISGAVEVLKENMKVTGKMKQLVESIVRESARLNQIISDFLDFAKGQKMRPQKILLSSFMEDIQQLLQHREDMQQQVRLELINHYPEVHIWGDEGQLKQVFYNLVINAVQAMEEGGVITIFMESEVRHGNDCVRIDVIDDGQGIDSEQQSKMFQPFFSTKTKGSGIGLSIVYRIIKEHEGEIDVQSELGKGTKISLWFKRKD